MERKSGVLTHVTSFPSKFGIGDLGKPAKDFIDLLYSSKQKILQILPIGPTEPYFDNSPYHAVSAFAMNPLFIDLEDILKEKPEEIFQFFIDESNTVNFEQVIDNKFRAFNIAYKDFQETEEFEKFCAENAFWLDDYTLFVALKKKFGNKPWQEWPKEFKERDVNALNIVKEALNNDVRFTKYLQFVAAKQFLEFRRYANDRGIKIIGDLPIYVDSDSPDLWANRELFDIDLDGYPVKVAGVPPDYFNENGQLWGNPVYAWEKHKAQNFSWWVKRISHLLEFVDIIRIDHFRGFVAYYAIKRGMPNAKVGEWIRVPVYDFFDTIKANFPLMPFIAEDLGLITDDVVEVIKHYQIPNMRILMFAFDGSPTNPYLPHNYENPTVVYTGTHDHNTAVGWFKFELPEAGKVYLSKYLGHVPTVESISLDLIRLAEASIAEYAIIPIQDVLGMDETKRMNSPGTASNNWRFILKSSDLKEDKLSKFMELTEIYGRA